MDTPFNLRLLERLDSYKMEDVMSIAEPKIGADIMCEVDCALGKRDLRVFTIRRPKMQPGWRVSLDASQLDVADWDRVLSYVKSFNPTDIEVSEHSA